MGDVRQVFTRYAEPVRIVVVPDGDGDVSGVVCGLLRADMKAVFARPFDRAGMSRPAVLDTFRSRVAPSYTAAFDKGVAALAAGDYGTAESSFKTVVTPTEDSTAGLTYLAATFAASGHDREAASAWQTALIDGASIPEIYQWLGDTLLRVHDLPHARAVLDS